VIHQVRRSVTLVFAAAAGAIALTAAGECGAGGYYIDGSGLSQAFVVSSTPSHTL
jgi:hypothetical protein